ncbi:MAG: Peptidase of plants and bacteria [Verrucomicrobiota bacterium]
MFLAWVEQQHGPKLVTKLNAALRQRKYSPELFQSATGKSLDARWADFAVELRGQQSVPK